MFYSAVGTQRRFFSRLRYRPSSRSSADNHHKPLGGSGELGKNTRNPCKPHNTPPSIQSINLLTMCPDSPSKAVRPPPRQPMPVIPAASTARGKEKRRTKPSTAWDRLCIQHLVPTTPDPWALNSPTLKIVKPIYGRTLLYGLPAQIGHRIYTLALFSKSPIYTTKTNDKKALIPLSLFNRHNSRVLKT